MSVENSKQVVTNNTRKDTQMSAANTDTEVRWTATMAAEDYATTDDNERLNVLRGMFNGNEDGLATPFQEASRDCAVERDEKSITLRFESKWSADVMGDYLEGWLQSHDGGLFGHVTDLGKVEFASLLDHYLGAAHDLTLDQEESLGTAIALIRGHKTEATRTDVVAAEDDPSNERTRRPFDEAAGADGRTEGAGGRVEVRTEDAQMMSKSERHAMTGYIDMLVRCYVPAHPDYINEGAHGIRVCDRWLVGFRNFIEDVGPPPEVAGDNGNQNGVAGGVE